MESVNLLQSIVPLARHTLRSTHYYVISRRFGFVDDTIYTLQEIATQFCLTRERIRQIEKSALKTVHDALREASNTPVVHEAREVYALLQQQDTLLTESDLERFFLNRYAMTSLNRRWLRFLLSAFGFTLLASADTRGVAVWSTQGGIIPSQPLAKARQAILTCLNKAHIPMSLSDLQAESGQDTLYLRCALKMLPEIESVKGGYQLKMDALHSGAEQAYRLLLAHKAPMHHIPMLQQINNQRALMDRRLLSSRGLRAQIALDPRFKAIGRSGIWILSDWQSVCTLSTVAIIKTFLAARGYGATVNDIHRHVVEKRPDVPIKSVMSYLSRKKCFAKISENHYGLAHWHTGYKKQQRKSVKRQNTLRQAVQEEVKKYLQQCASPPLLLTVKEHVIKVTRCNSQTFYAYLTEMPDVRKTAQRRVVFR